MRLVARLNFHFGGYKQKPFPKQIGAYASANGPAVSAPRWRPRRFLSPAQEGTSSWTSRSHHGQVPRENCSHTCYRNSGVGNSTQPESEKQAEIRLTIDSHYISLFLWASPLMAWRRQDGSSMGPETDVLQRWAEWLPFREQGKSEDEMWLKMGTADRGQGHGKEADWQTNYPRAVGNPWM